MKELEVCLCFECGQRETQGKEGSMETVGRGEEGWDYSSIQYTIREEEFINNKEQ